MHEDLGSQAVISVLGEDDVIPDMDGGMHSLVLAIEQEDAVAV